MARSRRTQRITAFRAFLNDKERWADQYVVHPGVTGPEREAGRSLQQYILHARVYASGIKPALDEIDRREQKINRMWLTLYEKWITRSPRP